MNLRERLAADQVTITAWSGVPDCLTVELLAGQPFDAVTLDMQHGGHHEDSVLRSIVPVQKVGKPVLVRIPVGRFDMASRALDFGADAVIAPMINSVDDARRFAAAMKYPPMGERSWGPTFGAPRAGNQDQQQWLKNSNDRVLAFAMVETRTAFDALDGILAVPGIDGIFVGPSDFSIAWSNGTVVDSTLEDMMDTVAAIAERTRKAGKFAAIYVIDPSVTGRVTGMGFRLIATGSEGQLFKLGAASLLRDIKSSIAG
ncbi:MAG: HpcH/HpaI aldolase/citrate lyase family protein [Rhizobiaceae bacterium]|nr:HpcH/HpaI aldolase/citrate lyase family protein [Rhizobiaceae bacterium]